MLPMMLLALPGGVLADAFDRRGLLLGIQCYFVVVALSLAVLAALGQVPPVLLLAFTFAIGMGTALQLPTWQPLITELVPRAQIPAATRLDMVNVNVSRAAGPEPHATAGVVQKVDQPRDPSRVGVVDDQLGHARLEQCLRHRAAGTTGTDQQRASTLMPGTWSRWAFTKARPSSISPCQPPSALRRIRLTTPSRRARRELVAQWRNASNLCGMVTRMPSTFGIADNAFITVCS